MKLINKEQLKNEYLKKYDIDLIEVKKDKLKIKRFINKNNLINYPGKYVLYKNKKTNVLYLTVTTLDFNINILGKSNKETVEEQLQELFPEYNFFEENAAGGFNLFPGVKNSIYGFSDESHIILGNNSQIIEF